jgi:uncharacterized LabA/DUF88 family protein
VKKTAVLMDLGFVLPKLYRPLGNRPATANEVHDFAEKCVQPPDEELFRVYCYHCPPYGETETHPITRAPVDFSQTSMYENMNKLLRQLSLKDNVAFRAGELSFDGWAIKKREAEKIAQSGRALTANDFVPDLKQKQVDIKIGLDVAWLASKGIVERIVLVTGDSDFIPAMKFARREGIQIILITMGHRQVKQELLVHADEIRSVTYP